jgi:hypothetical protein
VVATLTAGTLVNAAWAQLSRSATEPLAEPEVSAGLLGVELEGFSPTYRMRWRECIEPNGRTKYHTPEGVQNGRLRVTPGGMACFAYEDTGFKTESCFNVRRSGDQYVFSGALGFDRDTTGDLFVTTKLRRGVKTCPSSEDLIG